VSLLVIAVTGGTRWRRDSTCRSTSPRSGGGPSKSSSPQMCTWEPSRSCVRNAASIEVTRSIYARGRGNEVPTTLSQARSGSRARWVMNTRAESVTG
jgi:hypothetical protein